MEHPLRSVCGEILYLFFGEGETFSHIAVSRAFPRIALFFSKQHPVSKSLLDHETKAFISIKLYLHKGEEENIVCWKC